MRGPISRILICTLLLTVAAVSACSDADAPSDDPTASLEAETTQRSSPVSEVEFALPQSGVSAPLDRPYGFNADQSSRQAPPGEYPFPVNSVTARWYQSDGFYVVYFEDFPLDEPLCPGASIQLATGGFANAGNSPTGEGGCEGVPTLKEPPVGPYICGDGLVLFRTAVPIETQGELFASTNRQQNDGSGAGVLGHAPANASEAPEVDLSGCDPPTGG
jgi:hypothetical protein